MQKLDDVKVDILWLFMLNCVKSLEPYMVFGFAQTTQSNCNTLSFWCPFLKMSLAIYLPLEYMHPIKKSDHINPHNLFHLKNKGSTIYTPQEFSHKDISIITSLNLLHVYNYCEKVLPGNKTIQSLLDNCHVRTQVVLCFGCDSQNSGPISTPKKRNPTLTQWILEWHTS